MPNDTEDTCVHCRHERSLHCVVNANTDDGCECGCVAFVESTERIVLEQLREQAAIVCSIMANDHAIGLVSSTSVADAIDAIGADPSVGAFAWEAFGEAFLVKYGNTAMEAFAEASSMLRDGWTKP